MSDQGTPLTPDQVFKRVVWRSVLSVAKGIEQSTTWTITGIAAIVALFISNLDAVSKIVTSGGMRWSLILFAAALLSGSISKILGMAVQSGVATLNEMESLLASEGGAKLMDEMTTDPRQLVAELAEPFVWPMSWFMKRGGEQGIADYLSSDKRFVRMFCWQIYLNLLHALLAFSAIIVVAIAIIASSQRTSGEGLDLRHIRQRVSAVHAAAGAARLRHAELAAAEREIRWADTNS